MDTGVDESTGKQTIKATHTYINPPLPLSSLFSRLYLGRPHHLRVHEPGHGEDPLREVDRGGVDEHPLIRHPSRRVGVCGAAFVGGGCWMFKKWV